MTDPGEIKRGQVPRMENAQAILDKLRPPLTEIPKLYFSTPGAEEWGQQVMARFLAQGFTQEGAVEALTLIMHPWVNGGFTVFGMQ